MVVGVRHFHDVACCPARPAARLASLLSTEVDRLGRALMDMPHASKNLAQCCSAFSVLISMRCA
jgi:hypothetical protein